MSRNKHQAETTMSVIERYLCKHMAGDLITKRMIVQNCGIDKATAGRYIAYLIRCGLGKRAVDSTDGTTAIKFNPLGDQRTKKINWRKPEGKGHRSQGIKTVGYVENKCLPELPPAPKPAYIPPPVYAADPVMLDKLDKIAEKLDQLIKLWSTNDV